MKIFILCAIIPTLLLTAGVRQSPENISTSLALLVGVSGAVFTIMGIWIAFLYPEILKTLKSENVINADFSSKGEDTDRLKSIVGVVIKSATAMIFSMFAAIFIGTYENLTTPVQTTGLYIVEFLSIFFFCLQSSALISVIFINTSLVGLLERKNEQRARDWDT